MQFPTCLLRLSLATSLVAVTLSPASADNWPTWRGPAAIGISTETDLPTHWSANENIRWKTPLPERGNSTPVVWGSRIFVTQALTKDNRRSLLCFNRADGKLAWQ